MAKTKAIVRRVKVKAIRKARPPVQFDALAKAIAFVKARYDAAQTDRHNQLHWAAADNLAADCANDPTIRRILRSRARYEVANNSYAKGMQKELVNAVIGRGPRLQMQSTSREDNATIERSFRAWAKEVKLSKLLRTMRAARTTDGEAFILFKTNPLLNHPVKLWPELIEADQVATPDLQSFDPQAIDGMRFDEFGNVSEFHLLKAHPGDTRASFLGNDYDTIPAKAMVHYFCPERPGQHRGIPDFVPSLGIFADTRRFSTAVVAASETAAEYAGIVKTKMPPNGEADSMDPNVVMDIEKRSLLFAPAGWELDQLKAEQPVTTYNEYVSEKIGEAGRCLPMPRTVATGNTNNSSYASSRMDFRSFYKSIRTEQDDIDSDVLDRVLSAWLDEAELLSAPLAIIARRIVGESNPHVWYFEGMEDVDETKSAQADETNLRNNTDTLMRIWARKGYDWEDMIRQRAKERQLCAELGLLDNQTLPGGSPIQINNQNAEDFDA